MKILILGAGAWGTALAVSAARPVGVHQVSLWLRDTQQAQALQQQGCNQRYLPGIELPPALSIVAAPVIDLPRLAAGADLVLLATPMAALRQLLLLLRASSTPVVWLCKGFEMAQTDAGPGLLGHEIQAQLAPDMRAGVLSGPSFAIEVARGQPAALVAASYHESVRATLVAAFHSQTLRLYVSDDVTGVEVGGASKNVLAIAAGLCDGLGLGLNARAALITRGLAEMTRLGLALGARATTFMGLSGLGDLVLSSTGDLSRNRQVGLALAQGQNLLQVTSALGHVAEGVYSARTLVQRAQALGREMPIAQAVVDLLDAKVTPQQCLQRLMERQSTTEMMA